jgi:hypothetical protein
MTREEQAQKFKKLKAENKQLKLHVNGYRKAYEEFNCYFDSISDEEQSKLAKRLENIFKKAKLLK